MRSRTTLPITHHPYASVLRQRAHHLRQLAGAIECACVFRIDVDGLERGPHRARLCAAMLTRNLEQLHRAGDDLRSMAWRLAQRADELDAVHRARSAA